MRFFVFLLSLSIASVVNAQYQPYYDDILYPYPYSYPDYPISGIQPAIDENRLFFQLTSFFTTTSTSTTTTTTTCTVLAAAACVGRRRRSFLVDEDDIEPSPVHKVEVTQVAEMEASVRNERKADPQVAFWRGAPDYSSYELQSTFGQRPVPIAYNPFFRRPVVAADPRLFVRVTRTTTTTATVTSRSTPVCSSGSAFNQC